MGNEAVIRSGNISLKKDSSSFVDYFNVKEESLTKGHELSQFNPLINNNQQAKHSRMRGPHQMN